MSNPSNPNIPTKCNACGQQLVLESLFVDDGCPCNSPRGVNFKPQDCALCRTDNCVKPGHRISALFGFTPNFTDESLIAWAAEWVPGAEQRARFIDALRQELSQRTVVRSA